jgi:hypothetical protein
VALAAAYQAPPWRLLIVMASEPVPIHAEAPLALRRELKVVPLLTAYRDAMTLAGNPPPSLRLVRPLRRRHLWLRPKWGCRYFTTRYVRRRVDVLERAVSMRIALGEGDDNDQDESEAIKRFKAALPPAPSRLFSVAGLIAAILVTQLIATPLLKLLPDPDQSRITKALQEIDLTPDAKQVADIGKVLISAGFAEHGFILIALVATGYLFGRPLAAGYRLSHLCLGRHEQLSGVRQGSELATKAARHQAMSHERAAVQAAHVEFRREAPMDLLVKALPCLVVAYWLIGFARLDETPHTADTRLAGWAVAVLVIGAVTIAIRERMNAPRAVWQGAIGIGGLAGAAGATLAIVGLHALAHQGGDPIWFAFATLVLARFTWLVMIARDRRSSIWWLVAPMAIVCALAIASRYNPYA